MLTEALADVELRAALERSHEVGILASVDRQLEAAEAELIAHQDRHARAATTKRQLETAGMLDDLLEEFGFLKAAQERGEWDRALERREESLEERLVEARRRGVGVVRDDLEELSWYIDGLESRRAKARRWGEVRVDARDVAGVELKLDPRK